MNSKNNNKNKKVKSCKNQRTCEFKFGRYNKFIDREIQLIINQPNNKIPSLIDNEKFKIRIKP